MADDLHTPKYAKLRGHVTINGELRLLFHIPTGDPAKRPYLFACGPNGEAPACECPYRYPHKQDAGPCQLVQRSAEVAAKARPRD